LIQKSATDRKDLHERFKLLVLLEQLCQILTTRKRKTRKKSIKTLKQRQRRWKEIETEIENKYLSTSGVVLTCGDALTGEKLCVYKPDMMMMILIDNRITKHKHTHKNKGNMKRRGGLER